MGTKQKHPEETYDLIKTLKEFLFAKLTIPIDTIPTYKSTRKYGMDDPVEAPQNSIKLETDIIKLVFAVAHLNNRNTQDYSMVLGTPIKYSGVFCCYFNYNTKTYGTYLLVPNVVSYQYFTADNLIDFDGAVKNKKYQYKNMKWAQFAIFN
jgi:hypothetical protein